VSIARHSQLVVLLCLCLAPGPASGTPLEPTDANREPSPQDRAIAEALFRDGKALIAAERINEACAKFQESERLDPALGTLLHLATCYAQVGKTASAWAAFQSAVEMAHHARDAARESLARERALQLEAKLSRLVISAARPAQGMVIHVDDRALSQGILLTPLPFDPGSHVIEVTAPGKLPWSQKIELEQGPVTLDIRIPLLIEAVVQTKAPAAPRDTEAFPASRPTPQGSDFDWRLVGLISLGASGASVLMGSYFGLRADSQAKDANHHCVGQICNQQGIDEHASARRSAALANVGFGVGIVGLATGCYLVWFKAAAAKKAESAFWFGTGFGEVLAGGAF